MSEEAFWHLLSVTDPTRKARMPPPAFAKDKRIFGAAAALAEANGLYYPFIRRWSASGRAVPASEKPRWTRELLALSQFKEAMGLLNEVSKEAGVKYTVIKNSTAIEQVPRDLDVFVRPADRVAFVDALVSHGLDLRYEDEAEISLARPDLLRIDLYTRIHYLGRDFLEEEFLFASRALQASHGVAYPGLIPQAALLLDSIHGLLGYGAITMLDFLELTTLVDRVRNLDACREVAAASGWGYVFDRWLDRLQALRRQIYEQRTPVAFPLRHGRRFVMDCISSLDGGGLAGRERVALRLSLLWDRLVFFSENSGLDEVVLRSRLASGLVNSAGHGLRVLRGDRKGLYADSEKRRWEKTQKSVR